MLTVTESVFLEGFTFSRLVSSFFGVFHHGPRLFRVEVSLSLEKGHDLVDCVAILFEGMDLNEKS